MEGHFNWQKQVWLVEFLHSVHAVYDKHDLENATAFANFCVYIYMSGA